MPIKIRDIIKIIERDGWYVIRQRGSHRQYKHASKSGLVTIPMHKMNADVKPKTLQSILKQAQISTEEQKI